MNILKITILIALLFATQLKAQISPQTPRDSRYVNNASDANRNWIQTRVYDGDSDHTSNLVGESRMYFDELGRPIQHQSRSHVTGEVLAAEPLYDAFGRAVGQTLAAPTGHQQLKYRDKFLQNANGDQYDYTDFDAHPVGNQANTIGHYYSNQNTKEAYVPASDYPYNRVVYRPDGTISKQGGVGEAFKIGSGAELNSYYSSPSDELAYLYGYHRSYQTTTQSNDRLNPKADNLGRELMAVKQLQVGEDGIVHITYSANGKVLATAVSGHPDGGYCKNQIQRYKLHMQGDHSANIHVSPASNNTITIDVSNADHFHQTELRGYGFQITDMDSYNQLTKDVDYSVTLVPNEKIIITLLGSYTNSDQFLKVSCQYTMSNPYQNFAGEREATVLWLSVENDYSNWTLNYYNKYGQLSKTVPPEGIYCDYDANLQNTSNALPITTSAAQLTTGQFSSAILKPLAITTHDFPIPNLQSPTLNGHQLNFELIWSGNSSTLNGVGAQPSIFLPQYSSNYVAKYKIRVGIYGDNGSSHTLLKPLFDMETILRKDGSYQFEKQINPIALLDGDLSGYTRINIKVIQVQITNNNGNYVNASMNGLVEQALSFTNLELSVPDYNVYAKSEVPHQLAKTFHYDDYGHLLASLMPDEGLTEYIYDDEGKLRFSQDAQQRLDNEFSYLAYDKLGRLVESGVYSQLTLGSTQFFPSGNTVNTGDPNNVFNIRNQLDGLQAGGKLNPSHIQYDENTSAIGGSNYQPKHLEGQIARTWNANNETSYSYDENGQLSFSVQHIDEVGIKTMDYDYDFYGRPIKATFQKNSNERFSWLYKYNKAGQLIEIKTDQNGVVLTQGKFDYYLHGPLKRKELGDDVQGIDYTYTIWGALKAINHPLLDELNGDYDPGRDGKQGSLNETFAGDVFGMTVDYFAKDYERTNTRINYGLNPSSNERHNGTIKSVRWNTKGSNHAGSGKENLYEYGYDWKGQLTSARFGVYTPNSANNSQLVTSYGSRTNAGGQNAYAVKGLSYDKNGNIQTLIRFDQNGIVMDDLTYNYQDELASPIADGLNRLDHVKDAAHPNFNGFAGLEDVSTQSISNYQYNAIGQITQDGERNMKVRYHHSGKVEKVYTVHNNKLKVAYKYNERGEKISKTTYDANGNKTKSTYYVREVSGAIVSLYEKDYGYDGPTVVRAEVPLAGLGTWFCKNNDYHYVLTDHLGNVRATVNRDKDSHGEAKLESYADYYPYGMTMPGRNNSGGSENYRYGYQGQELDEDLGIGGMYAFSLRLYDQRLGKWLSPDPYQQFASPYLGMSNNPISFIDPDGGFALSVGLGVEGPRMIEPKQVTFIQGPTHDIGRPSPLNTNSASSSVAEESVEDERYDWGAYFGEQNKLMSELGMTAEEVEAMSQPLDGSNQREDLKRYRGGEKLQVLILTAKLTEEDFISQDYRCCDKNVKREEESEDYFDHTSFQANLSTLKAEFKFSVKDDNISLLSPSHGNQVDQETKSHVLDQKNDVGRIHSETVYDLYPVEDGYLLEMTTFYNASKKVLASLSLSKDIGPVTGKSPTLTLENSAGGSGYFKVMGFVRLDSKGIVTLQDIRMFKDFSNLKVRETGEYIMFKNVKPEAVQFEFEFDGDMLFNKLNTN